MDYDFHQQSDAMGDRREKEAVNKDHQEKMKKILIEVQRYAEEKGYDGVCELMTRRMKEEGIWDDSITLESIMDRKNNQ